jgi:DNA-binding Lrp family transcriptional regulator
VKPPLDDIDRRIVNRLQDGLPVCERPFLAAAEELGIAEDDLLDRLRRLKATGFLSRIGPMFNVARIGGGLTLCAMAVPAADFEQVAALVNGFPEVAHNYERDHAFNMWFVLATETPERIGEVLNEIERLTNVKVLNLPKQEEYFIGMKVEA